jgi:hypothetical protein
VKTSEITIIQKDYSEDDVTQTEAIVLGAVVGEHDPDYIAVLFEEWMSPLMDAGTPPDADSDFISWLVKEKGFQEAAIPNIVTI